MRAKLLSVIAALLAAISGQAFSVITNVVETCGADQAFQALATRVDGISI